MNEIPRFSTDDSKINRRPFLKHSRYKAVKNQYSDNASIQEKLHDIRMKELNLIIEHKLEHIVLLHQNLLPLQALLDRVIDEPNNFNINLSDARLHRCEGTF